jgi:hypothetical protein
MVSIGALERWDEVRQYLPAGYEQLAADYEQVETKFGNAKLRTADDLLRVVLLHVGANLPLRQTVTLMAESGGPSLSPMRLHKKMCRAAPYLRDLVTRMLDWPLEGAAERWGGYVFTAVDATVVSGPGSIGTDARIHTKLRVADVSFVDVQVTDEKVGETFVRFTWEPGELAVGDRAYCATRGVRYVVDAGADVLVRYRLDGIPLCTPQGVAVDVLKLAQPLAVGEVTDVDVQVPIDGRSPIDGRLIAMRLPPDAADRARKRFQRDNKKTSAQTLLACDFVILFTTATRQRLDSERCLQGYRLRWQIELQFKRWKSLGHFDCLPNVRDDTTLAWLYGKVLLGLLLDRMASTPAGPFPPGQGTRSNTAPDVLRPLEADQPSLSVAHRRSAASLAVGGHRRLAPHRLAAPPNRSSRPPHST